MTRKQAQQLADRYERYAMQLESDRVQYLKFDGIELQMAMKLAFESLRTLTQQLARIA